MSRPKGAPYFLLLPFYFFLPSPLFRPEGAPHLFTFHFSLVTPSFFAPRAKKEGGLPAAFRSLPRALYLRSFRRRTIANAPKPSRLIVAGSGTEA